MEVGRKEGKIWRTKKRDEKMRGMRREEGRKEEESEREKKRKGYGNVIEGNS